MPLECLINSHDGRLGKHQYKRKSIYSPNGGMPFMFCACFMNLKFKFLETESLLSFLIYQITVYRMEKFKTSTERNHGICIHGLILKRIVILHFSVVNLDELYGFRGFLANIVVLSNKAVLGK